MSVRTSADDQIDELKESIKKATENACLAYVDISVTGKVWGASDYSPDFHSKLRRIQELLIEANELMK